MRLMLIVLMIGLVLMGGVSVASAQADSCPAFIDTALAAVGEGCGDLARNTICYGYNRVDATFFETVEEGFFSKPTDRSELTNVATVQTAALDHTFDQWGIAVMNVQANVPDTLPGQAVTFLLIGDATLQNDVSPDEALIPGDSIPVRVNSGERVNLRSGPGTNTNVVESIAGGSILDAVGQNEAGDWVRVLRETGYAWIAATLLQVSNDNAEAFANLPIVSGEALTPMQAFYFSTGIGTSTCLEAPEMLVIQGPQEARVNFKVNGLDMNIGSTIVLLSERTDYATLLAFEVQAEKVAELGLPDDTVCLNNRLFVLDGDAQINNGETRVPLGHFTQSVACLNPDGIANAFTSWDEPVRLTQNELALFSVLELIPENLLRYPIEIPSDEDIDRGLNIATPVPTQRPSTGGQTQPRPTQQGGGQQVQPTQAPQGFSCAGFRITSPPDGGTVVFGPNTFYWDGIAGVNAYQVEINTLYDDGTRAGSGLIRVGANQTNITVDFSSSQFGRGTIVQWRAQALQGAEPNFVSVCDTPYVTNRVVFP